ncbi:MAG: NUDIX domain-containing protein [Candidatus Moranbacteria bacterium]|nr:NUDIX domain-containing protein [Candidatus Moranbacteria bacterium]
MGIPISKLGLSKEKKEMHYSVGALIEKNGKYLLIDRSNPPFGFAGPAGHVDEGETEIEALVREVREESGLEVKGFKLLFEEYIEWNACKKGMQGHYWYLFGCETEGEVKKNDHEETSIGWYTREEIKKLKLEPVWEYWFRKLGIIP